MSISGMAINDVQEIMNASMDKTWKDMMWKIIVLENGLPKPIREKYKVFKTPESKIIRVFPNVKDSLELMNIKANVKKTNDVNSAEILFEQSINDEVLKICKTRIDNEENEAFNN